MCFFQCARSQVKPNISSHDKNGSWKLFQVPSFGWLCKELRFLRYCKVFCWLLLDVTFKIGKFRRSDLDSHTQAHMWILCIYIYAYIYTSYPCVPCKVTSFKYIVCPCYTYSTLLHLALFFLVPKASLNMGFTSMYCNYPSPIDPMGVPASQGAPSSAATALRQRLGTVTPEDAENPWQEMWFCGGGPFAGWPEKDGAKGWRMKSKIRRFRKDFAGIVWWKDWKYLFIYNIYIIYIYIWHYSESLFIFVGIDTKDNLFL